MIRSELSAAAELVLPVLAGYLFGALIRRGTGRSAIASFGIAVLALPVIALGVVILAPRVRLGIWDGILIGGLVAISELLTAARAGRRVGWSEALLLASATLAALWIADAVVALTLRMPPGLVAAHDAPLLLPRLDAQHPEQNEDDPELPVFHIGDQCAFIYAERYPFHLRQRIARASPPARVVLQLGDSMTFGLGVRADEAFPALLEKKDPQVAQINAGVPATSVDFHYALFRHWIDRLPAPLERVELNVFVNDYAELDNPYPCCLEAPLLSFESGRAVERCPRPSWPEGYGESLDWFVRHSPVPYPVRVADHFSALSRLLHVWFLQARSAPARGARDPELEWRHMEAILRAFRDDLHVRRIPLVVVLLPSRRALEQENPERTEDYAIVQRLRAICEGLRVPVLDPWNYFAELVRRDGAEKYFLPEHDIHMSPEGHARLADWLHERVGQHVR